jgi:hypothetical protein
VLFLIICHLAFEIRDSPEAVVSSLSVHAKWRTQRSPARPGNYE